MQNKLTKKNVAAIILTCQTAKKVQQDFPEVAEMYRRGVYISEIVKILDIDSTYGIQTHIAQGAVQKAIRGHNSALISSDLDGLITDIDQLNELEIQHKSQSARENYQRRVGLAGLTAEQKSQIGEKGARRAREIGRGIAALTSEQLIAAGKKGAVESMKVRGITPWSDRERKCAYRLSRSSDYQHQSGRYKGGIKVTEISHALNEQFHSGQNVRNRSGVSAMLCNLQIKNHNSISL